MGVEVTSLSRGGVEKSCWKDFARNVFRSAPRSRILKVWRARPRLQRSYARHRSSKRSNFKRQTHSLWFSVDNGGFSFQQHVCFVAALACASASTQDGTRSPCEALAAAAAARAASRSLYGD